MNTFLFILETGLKLGRSENSKMKISLTSFHLLEMILKNCTTQTRTTQS